MLVCVFVCVSPFVAHGVAPLGFTESLSVCASPEVTPSSNDQRKIPTQHFSKKPVVPSNKKVCVKSV